MLAEHTIDTPQNRMDSWSAIFDSEGANLTQVSLSGHRLQGFSQPLALILYVMVLFWEEGYFTLSVSRKKMMNSSVPMGLEGGCKCWITGCKGAVGDCKQFFTEQSQALLKGRINLVHWNRTQLFHRTGAAVL